VAEPTTRTPVLDVQRVREQFPGLSREVAGRPAVFLDGPAGSQVPQRVADASAHYLLRLNANSGGAFATSRETERMLAEAHRAVADLLGTDDPDLVIFGANMTTLTLHFARSYARMLGPGDEVVVSRLEHDANFTPWVQAAGDAGAMLREVAIRTEDCTLDLGDLEAKLSNRTRLVAVTAASNAVGSLTPLARIAELVHGVGAELYVDAVHYAPHGLIDVEAFGCDYLACSAYKFFGPHVGILWGRREALERAPAYKLRPPSDTLPGRFMTGTPNHEGIAGTLAAIDYLADLGRAHAPGASDRRAALGTAFEVIRAHERGLFTRLLAGLRSQDDVKVWGITDPARLDERVPTVAFTHARHTPLEIARHLGERGVFVWDGNYYALPLTEALGLEPEGMVRVGLLHYNTADEVDRLLECLRELG
jgi:cysteine desulfurase family protein (TIGR01976 family)